MMNNPNPSCIENSMRAERNDGASRAFGRAFSATTNWLRQQHEIALRRPPVATRMASANATPA